MMLANEAGTREPYATTPKTTASPILTALHTLSDPSKQGKYFRPQGGESSSKIDLKLGKLGLQHFEFCYF